jgi:hypothetical protein
MSYISVIVIYLDNAAENACISSDFGCISAENVADNVPCSVIFSLILHCFPLNWCTLVHVFLQCLIRWIEVGCMAYCFPVNTLMVSKNF